MMPKFALSMLVALAVCAPLQEAAAQESTLGGALFGGAAGAIVGGALGGGRGAAIGAIVGAGTGAAIGAQGEPRPRRLSLVSGRLLPGAARRLGRRFRRAIAVSRRNTHRRRPVIMTTRRAACARRAMIRAVARSSAATATSDPARKHQVLITPSGRTACGRPSSSIET